MAYAEQTTISVSRTKADIEEMVTKAGADQFVSGFSKDKAVIGFTLNARQIRFILPMPDKNDPKFWYTESRKIKRTSEQAYTAWEQNCRSKWRSLYLIIKAKLEAINSGISTVEKEFLYNIVLPDGEIVGEWMTPQLEATYQNGQMPPMLPMLEE